MGAGDGQVRADELIEALGLDVLAGESGWWRLITESDVPVSLPGGRRLPASNTLHLVLSPDRPVNRWHVLESDDVHVLVEGGPVEYVLLPAAAPPRRIVLGHDLGAGETPVVIAAAGVWTGLRLVDPSTYAWIVTTVTPAWSPDRAGSAWTPACATASWTPRRGSRRLSSTTSTTSDPAGPAD